MKAMNESIVIAALYKFAEIENVPAFADSLKSVMLDRSIKGTIIVAPEGINGTISGVRADMDYVLGFIKSDSRFHDIEHKESFMGEHPFKRCKVKQKSSLIPLGAEVNPRDKVGTYVDWQEWNRLIENPDVLVIDTRNNYEVEIGRFKNAIDPETEVFSELPEYVERNLAANKSKPIAMYCTGGIRCEKFSSYLLEQGFDKVYHLKGGILKYLEEVPESENLFEGECFVFDDRRAVDAKLNSVNIAASKFS